MKIDLGCGKQKKEGYIGIDCVKLKNVDIVCDVNVKGIPLKDEVVDEVYSMHFLEHVDDVKFVMDEIWRVCKNGAIVKIAVPYFLSVGAFRDPTHKHFFAYNTFDHFTDTNKFPNFYSESRFIITKKRILFYPSNLKGYQKLRFAHMMPFQFIAYFFPYLYEHSLLKLFAARDLYVELQVIKDK